MTRERELHRDAFSNYVVPGVCVSWNGRWMRITLFSGGMPAPSPFPSFYNSGERRDGFYLLPQVPSSQFSTTDNRSASTSYVIVWLLGLMRTISGGGGSSRGVYRMASSDMRELKAHIMQVHTRRFIQLLSTCMPAFSSSKHFPSSPFPLLPVPPAATK